jgi:hypothetical protein
MSACVSSEELAWYEIRDCLLGENFVDRSLKKALELAAVCKHPEAQWLTNLFAGRDMSTVGDAKRVFQEHPQDARAVCFAALVVAWQFDVGELRRSAELGFEKNRFFVCFSFLFSCSNAFAQAKLSGETHNEERFRWADDSAAQMERDGYLMRGFHLVCSFG